MPDFDASAVRRCLKDGKFVDLFIEQLGWDHHKTPLAIQVDGRDWALKPIAHKRGLVVYHCVTPATDQIPDHALRKKIEHQVARSVREHIIVFSDEGAATQVWQWVKREPGKPLASRETKFHSAQSGEALAQKLRVLAVSIADEEATTLPDVLNKVSAAFNVEKVTKKFYEDFKKQHTAFLGFIDGITDLGDQEWYASVMLNRLMFVYFVQRKGFLDGDTDYLTNRLERCQREHGKDKFYSFYREFLLRLFHEGLGGKERTPELNALIGRIPYLNGGLFEQHEIEDRYPDIQMPDEAFEKVFAYFDRYQWHLDERPLRADNEINPDVLGYIFEKYINQKQMGAYYTKEDITEYISKNTIIPFLVDAARKECKVAFENPGGPTVWDLLREDPDRYIYPAVLHGVDSPLPDDIAVGVNPPTLHDPVGSGPVQTLELRKGWNRPAPSEFALPTETWREVVARRQRCEDVRTKLRAGDVRDVNDLITLNLDIRQFVQDAIETSEGPALLRAFWHAVEKITVLDPTCGSGAFLFAALNILQPLYDACLDRMEAFVDDLDRSDEKHSPEKFSDFRRTLEHVAAHPNRDYFIFKSIILNNLYGVDIMEEAVEICKLRLFLKLAAQVEPDASADNIGIEPLPDIDFNIRAGNTLVGFATYADVEKALTYKMDFDNALKKISVKAADLQQSFDSFRQRQVEGDGSVPAVDKAELRQRLNTLDEELDAYLAREYGVASGKGMAYEKWKASYQPFHWFVEFYSIMQSGGFDAVIGNPPYLEYSKVASYRVRGYETERCANLYAFTVERLFDLVSMSGRGGMIIPISMACSGAMEPLRGYVSQSSRSLWLSHFSNRPGQLFTGAQNRLTIFLTAPQTAEPDLFSTRYHRWDARGGERDRLFALLGYQHVAPSASMFHGLLPKVGSPQSVALSKIGTNKSVSFLLKPLGTHRVFWVRVPGYFCQFLTEPPMARPERGGRAQVRGEVNDVRFDDEGLRNVVHAILNSSTYYQFFCVYTDTRHINPSDVTDFPLNVSDINKRTFKELSRLSARLTDCFTEHTTQRRKSGLLIDSVDAKDCKSLIDEIDVVLARHYAFTEDELDFIINYDIKYRMGRDAEGEED